MIHHASSHLEGFELLSCPNIFCAYITSSFIKACRDTSHMSTCAVQLLQPAIYVHQWFLQNYKKIVLPLLKKLIFSESNHIFPIFISIY